MRYLALILVIEAIYLVIAVTDQLAEQALR